MNELELLLTETIGLSKESAHILINEYGELAVHTHAMHCLYAMDQGRVKWTAPTKQDTKRKPL